LALSLEKNDEEEKLVAFSIANAHNTALIELLSSERHRPQGEVIFFMSLKTVTGNAVESMSSRLQDKQSIQIGFACSGNPSQGFKCHL
jgi:hypothetical protein